MTTEAKPERLLRRPQVEARVGLKRTQIYDLMKRNEFPQAVKLGARAVAWVEAEIDEWIRARVAASRAA